MILADYAAAARRPVTRCSRPEDGCLLLTIPLAASMSRWRGGGDWTFANPGRKREQDECLRTTTVGGWRRRGRAAPPRRLG